MMKTAYVFPTLIMALITSISSTQTSAQQGQSSTLDNSGSEVRIVRLSLVRGKALMDRGIGTGFETAFANLPITQGTKLETIDGNAEVEFEDNSTLRLVPGTQVEFTTLARSSSGATNSTLHLIRGTVYADLEKSKGNTFALVNEAGTAFLAPHSIVRLTAGSEQNDLAVFEGIAAFQSPGGSRVPVGEMKGLLLDPALQVKKSFVINLSPGPFDSWEQGERAFHETYSKASTLSGSPSMYGIADLNYYGSFAELPGCGRVWRPYFAGAAWDPYSSGIWAWYPAAGYSWVSQYPWGWAPFHYGAWQQCLNGVWGWTPGGTWHGLDNTHSPAMGTHPGLLQHPYPTQPSRKGDVKLLLASTQPPVRSGMDASTHAFIFSKDSAGLGIPRQTFGDLSRFSATAQQAGSASAPMYAVVSWTVRSVGTDSSGKDQQQRTPVTIWVPANDPRLQQAANKSGATDREADAISRSRRTALLPTDSSKGSAASQIAATAAPDGTKPPTAAVIGLSTRQRTYPSGFGDAASAAATAEQAAEARNGGAITATVLH